MTRVLVLLVSAVAFTASAEGVTIKLGTLAPVGSSWHLLLKEMAERFSDESKGAVKLKIYPGGTQGSEGDMIRKMGVGQLQAASISNVGLHDISPEPIAFSAPGMASEDTVGPLLAKVQGTMEAALLAKGYVVLQWARVGTVYVFCKKPYRTPQEAADGKFFVWEGDPGSVEAFRLMGLKPVVLASTDIIPSMETGMISCVTQVPAYVLTTRLHEKAPTMVDVPWSYLIGATVVRKDVWEKIDPAVRARLEPIAVEFGKRVDADVKKLNEDAIAAMRKQGLQVITVDATPWTEVAKRSWPAVRGKVVPAGFFDELVKLRDGLPSR